MKTYKTIVIGAGPAGMMASIQASSKGDVCCVDTNPIPGQKLLLTGGGRCNITVHVSIQDFLKGIPVNSSFLYSALYQLSPERTIQFFREQGVPLKEEDNHAMYPVTDQASTIQSFFRNKMRTEWVEYVCGSVTAISKKENNLFDVKVVSKKGSCKLVGESVILATGGKSYSSTGSNGSGYELAEKLGHTIHKPRAGLVSYEANPYLWESCQGVTLKNIIVRFYQSKIEETGDILFTRTGFSGPVMLNASLRSFHAEEMGIQFCPNETQDTWKRYMKEWRMNRPKLTVLNWLSNRLPRRIAHVILVFCKIPIERIGAEVTSNEQTALIRALDGGIPNSVQKNSLSKAMVTLGGVNSKEINPKTMESKICPSLYLAGEVIDIHGKTGGYNLQIALSTGYVAGNLQR